MKKARGFALLGIFTSALARADSAVYVVEDARLTIPSAVVLQYGAGSYYRNVKFEHNGNGVWRFAGGDKAALAHVDDMDIAAFDPVAGTVKVTLQGYKSLPCVGLEEPVVTRRNKTFHIVVAETQLPDNVRCVTMIEPFTLAVTLDVGDIPRGTWAVDANGVLSHFDKPAL